MNIESCQRSPTNATQCASKCTCSTSGMYEHALRTNRRIDLADFGQLKTLSDPNVSVLGSDLGMPRTPVLR